MNWFKRTFDSKKQEARGKKKEAPAFSSYPTAMGTGIRSGMLVVTGNGEEPNRQDKNKNADHEKQEAVHNYSTPLLSVVAMIKVAAKIIRPTTKILKRNMSPEMNWPMTKAARNNFPTSYKALANSLRCVFPKLITCLNIISGRASVKLNFGTIHLFEARP